MSGLAPVIDHVVVNARDALEDRAALFERLGFVLTPPSRHTLGSINRTAVFARDYLELVGIDREASAPRAELLRSQIGFEGLVFAAADADEVHRTLRARGIEAAAPIEFARPVGAAEARFRVVRLNHVPFGRCYFCQHLTPELVWRPEWQHQPNGARAIRRVVIAAREPEALAGLFRQMFDGAADQVQVVAAERDAIAELELGVRALDEPRRALEARGVVFSLGDGRLLVPVMGATLAFSGR